MPNIYIKPIINLYPFLPLLFAAALYRYIVSYVTKAERELGQLIKTAQREAREEGNLDAVKELRHLGRVYVSHREVNNI